MYLKIFIILGLTLSLQAKEHNNNIKIVPTQKQTSSAKKYTKKSKRMQKKFRENLRKMKFIPPQGQKK